jgi:hypothetical protein
MPKSDSLLDLSNPVVQEFIKSASARGSCLQSELYHLLPKAKVRAHVQPAVSQLSALGIEVMDDSPPPFTLAAAEANRTEPRLREIRDGVLPCGTLSDASPFVADPGLGATQDGEGRRRRDHVITTAQKDYISSLNARQGTFFAAIGHLAQFNAIVAAILGAALTIIDVRMLKFSISAALLLHVVAAFILLWAARPLTPGEPMRQLPSAFVVLEHFRNVDHTFRNYRLGWRMTVVAFAAASVAAVVFVLHNVGVTVPDVVSTRW